MLKAERFFTHPFGIILSAGSAAFLWGSAFPAIKLSYSLLDIQPNESSEMLLFAGYRFILAALLIFIFLGFTRKQLQLQKADIKPLAKIGLFQTFIQYVLFYIGLSYSSGVQGSIIAGTTTFFQILFAHFLYDNDKLSMRKGWGLLLGFSGVIVVNVSKGNLAIDFGIGEVLLLVAMASGGYGNILARNASRHMEVGYITSYEMVFGAIGLILVAMPGVGLFPFSFSLEAAGLLLYLSFLSAAGYILWNNVMKYNQVGKISVYLFLMPVFGVFLSLVFLNEKVSTYVFFGLLLVTIGIVIVNREKKSESPHIGMS
ncbi:DMT family transporter [Peribacillus alkalitolerans]|uniref:DMT family transporter n=1 Tax=Peribacillus alkalitolerans TaxID=1550385 RepID=UPI0013D498BE|nr:DMT family transporter [Peribacillus alkalitolerans]